MAAPPVRSRVEDCPARHRRGSPQQELPNRYRSPTPRTFSASTDPLHRNPPRHISLSKAVDARTWEARAPEGTVKGLHHFPLLLQSLQEREAPNVHFSVESEAHGDHRHTPETHRASHWLQRLATSPCSVGLCVSTRANHKHPWCFISPNGCGTPASSRHSPFLFLAKGERGSHRVVHLSLIRAMILPGLFFIWPA